MIIDATFWVAISFFIFIGLLIYFKIPEKIQKILDENINNIRNQINDAENLKEEAKDILSDHEKKISNSKREIKILLDKANEKIEKNIIKVNK
jgi:F-type H+-transporting ATPase subunit b